jgi:hypothetical protein
MLTEIALFFDEMFTGWRVPCLTLEPGTLAVRSLMPAPSPGISRIRSSAIQLGLELVLSAEFPCGRNWNGGYSLENSWNVHSRQAFGFWGTQRFGGSYARNFDFDETDATRFTNGHIFASGVAVNFGIPYIEGALGA